MSKSSVTRKPTKTTDLPPIKIPVAITEDELVAIDSIMGKFANAALQLPKEYTKLREALQLTVHILAMTYQQCEKMKPNVD